jgi:hypothetical protein
VSTFLEIVNDVERESGTIAQSQRLSTVAGAVGRQEKIVEWVAAAWRDIQKGRLDWTFLRKEGSHALVADQARYTATELGLTDFAGWLQDADAIQSYTLYDADIGRSDESRLQVLPYRVWKDVYDVGTHDAMRPIQVAFDNERRLCFGNTPDKAYVARFPYRRAVQILTDDADEPYIDDRHHNAIMWLALVYLAEHDEAPMPIGTAMNRYRAALSAMVSEYTEPTEL